MNTLIITTQWGRWAQLTPLTSLTVLTANLASCVDEHEVSRNAAIAAMDAGDSVAARESLILDGRKTCALQDNAKGDKRRPRPGGPPRFGHRAIPQIVACEVEEEDR